MRSIIVTASVHHGNTRKLVDAIAESFDVEILDATAVQEKDLSEYDLIGFASGQFFSKFHKSVLSFASKNLPENKKVFLITTYGGKPVWNSLEDIVKAKNSVITGRFGCKGYDTFGPFKLVGGIAKGHPDEKDISDAIEFYKGLVV